MRRGTRYLHVVLLVVGSLLLTDLAPSTLEADVLTPRKDRFLIEGGRQNQFVRGDANCDGRVDISDPAFIFTSLTGLIHPACEDAADVDDDGDLSIPDALNIWNFLNYGAPIPHPFPDPGLDTTFDELTCESACPYPPDTTISALDTLWASEVLGSPEESGIPMIVYGSANDTTQSYSIALCFDHTKLQVDSMSLVGTLVDSVWGVQQLGVKFLIWDNDEGWCKVVVAYPFSNPDPPPFFRVLPPFTHQPLTVVYFSVLPGVSTPDTVRLDLEDGCGDIDNVFSTQDFVSILPTLMDGNLIIGDHALSLAVEPSPPPAMDEGETVAVVVTATDNNPDHTITLGATGLPPFGSGWDDKIGTIEVVDTLILSPDYCDASLYEFSLHANCSGGYAVDTLFSLTVNDVNRPPQLEVGPPRVIVAGESVDFVVSATDLDYQECGEDTLHLIASGLPSGMTMEVVSPTSWRFIWATTEADTGVYFLSLTVEDLHGASDSDTLSLAVVVQASFPFIRFVQDVPNDQGHQVRIRWLGSVYDGPDTTYTIAHYAIWRRVDGFSGQGGEIREMADVGEMLRNLKSIERGVGYRIADGKEIWDFLATIPAHHDLEYAYVAPTLVDSASGGVHYSVFFVSAHTTDPDIFFDSPPDSGYSVDNLAPAPPRGLRATVSDGSTILFWRPSREEDFAHYGIYRGSCPDFEPDMPFDYTADTSYADPAMGYCYKVSAFDFAGNESDLTGPVTVEEMGNSSPSPRAFVLSQNYPNPFNPTTEIRFALPTEAYVTLEIYDLLGQRVATLVDERQTAGYKMARWDASAFASGIYLYRLRAGEYEMTRRMVLLR